MNEQGPDSTPRPGVSREELDRLFDRELSSRERRVLSSRLRHDPERLDEVIDTRRMIGMMRAPLDGPDLTDTVLAGVARRRGFLSARLRRRVRGGRFAVAATLLLSLGVVAVAHRAFPGRFTLDRRPTPVSDLGDAVRDDSLRSRERLEKVVRRLGRFDLVSAAGVSDRESEAGGGLVSDSLAVFHVDDADAGLDPVGVDPSRFMMLRLTADAEALALGGHRLVMPPMLPLSDGGTRPEGWLAAIETAPPLTMEYAPGGVTGETFAGAAGRLTDRALGLNSGLVPLTARVPMHSAYIGRLDAFRDDVIERRLRAAAEAAERDNRSTPRTEHLAADESVSK